MNGTPIPPGHRFGAKEPATEAVQSDRRDKGKSRLFQWGKVIAASTIINIEELAR